MISGEKKVVFWSSDIFFSCRKILFLQKECFSYCKKIILVPRKNIHGKEKKFRHYIKKPSSRLQKTFLWVMRSNMARRRKAKSKIYPRAFLKAYPTAELGIVHIPFSYIPFFKRPVTYWQCIHLSRKFFCWSRNDSEGEREWIWFGLTQ